MKGVGVEDLADGRVHQGQQRVARDVVVAGDGDALDHRVLDDAERDGDAVGTLRDDRRCLIGEIAQIGNRAQVGGDDGARRARSGRTRGSP